MVYDVVSSTNDVARSWALSGVCAGAVITSTSQSKGRGRRGASWHDTPGQSAIMTFVGSELTALENLWRLSFVASLAVQRAVAELGADSARVKWPNDVLCDGRKLAGILIETVPGQGGGLIPLIGIGVNVAQRRFEDSADYVVPPTSLSLMTRGKARSPIRVVEAVAKELDAAVRLAGTWSGWEQLMSEWQSVLETGREQAGMKADGAPVSGCLLSVRAEDGAALVQTDDGGVEAIFPAMAAR